MCRRVQESLARYFWSFFLVDLSIFLGEGRVEDSWSFGAQGGIDNPLNERRNRSTLIASLIHCKRATRRGIGPSKIAQKTPNFWKNIQRLDIVRLSVSTQLDCRSIRVIEPMGSRIELWSVRVSSLSFKFHNHAAVFCSSLVADKPLSPPGGTSLYSNRNAFLAPLSL